MTKQIVSDSRPGGARPHFLQTPGMFAAIMLGLGSVLGTGVFVGLGIGTQIAGPAVLLGLIFAALVAICSGLSTAQIANAGVGVSATPRPGGTQHTSPSTGESASAGEAASSAGLAAGASGSGTYEYGSRYLNARLGFTAAWLYLWAKSASAATAALGIAGYILSAFGIANEFWRVGVGLIALLLIVAIVLRGGVPWTRLTTISNLSIGGIALFALILFIIGGLPHLLQRGEAAFQPFFLPPSSGTSPLRSALHASALMFMGYVGYGRIAMLSHEVRDAPTAIPRAIVATILVSLALYAGVLAVALASVGAPEFARITMTTSAPLEIIATTVYSVPGVGLLIAAGAVAAMLGILLNLVQSLARLVLTMGRRKDMPNAVARVSRTTHVPEMAIVAVGILVALLALIGDLRFTWELSAFMILIYYAITNLAALQLPPALRRYPRAVSAAGLLSCLFLAFWLDPGVWLAGVFITIAGHGWRWIMRRL